MADTSTIEWTDATWNVVTGCDKVSPGCEKCYAETFAERWRGTKGHHFENGFDITLRPERLDLPFKWHKPKRVFVNSMSDLFHKDIPDEYIARVFATMARTPQHTYQILTKRHGRMRSLLGSHIDGGQNLLEAASDEETAQALYDAFWPLPNVHLGVSVENQHWADIRIPALLDTAAAVRWISAEPLLGPIDLNGPIIPGRGRPKLTYWLTGRPGLGEPRTTATDLQMHPLVTGPRLNWVVVGGESGHGARPMSPDWARSLRDQCQNAGVPYLFKQWGEYAPTSYMAIGAHKKGHVHVGDPIDDLGHRWEMRRVGKGKAGRELDGRTWDEFPNTP
ncbi:DUF5131 family protein [Streptomyces hebeiensis]